MLFRWSELPANDWITLNAKLRHGFAQGYTNAQIRIQTIATSVTPVHTQPRELVLVNTATVSVTVTLPLASTRTQMSQIYKKTAAVNTMTLDGNGAETIDGALTLAITTLNQAVELVSDGTTWHRVT